MQPHVHSGRIYVACPDLRHMSGGLRMLYRHADVLNTAGYSATIVHQKPGFVSPIAPACSPIVYSPVTIAKHDILVLPEILGPSIASFGRGVRKVIFNQNAYYTFWGLRCACEIGRAHV